MASSSIVEFRIGDIVRLRKPHPCGGYEWRVYRLGADIGLRCQTCGHHVLLARSLLEKRLKKFVERGPEVATIVPALSPVDKDADADSGREHR